MRRWFAVVFVLALAVAAAFILLVMSRRPPTLSVVTWAGAYGRAQSSALFIPYQARSGADLHIAEYDGGLRELRNAVSRGRYPFDAIDLELPDAVAACRQGLLERIDPASLPAGRSGEPAAQDFVAGAIGGCWIGSVVYSQIVGFDPRRFSGTQPSSLADFFDLARFPGPRALRGDSAKMNLELALLADGVAPAEVYRALETDEGLGRAFAKLDSIRGSLVWWTRSDEPVEMLADGRAAMATLLNGSLFDAAAHHRRIGAIWDRQLYEMDVFAIPKGDPKRAMALDFIRFATAPSSLARMADWAPYGPARLSALGLVGRNPELGIAMTPFLPTAPSHFKTAFAVDDGWWLDHGAEIEARWRAWLRQ
ncbi:MAG TPA: extracellular solute-binding protein [Rhizomicrobium sp.]|nr:extracellular solute-binding protein [Rhizomicrobium sp.]